MDFDVIIIGGSFAGHAAAIQLGRARRRVLLLDKAQPRNRFAKSSHGFLGQDGASPDEILQTFQRQLTAYVTVDQVSQTAISVSASDGGFGVHTPAERYFGHQIVLAGGVSDHMQKTSVPGVFAAGDAATAVSNAMLSAAAGTRAGISAHASLIFD